MVVSAISDQAKLLIYFGGKLGVVLHLYIRYSSWLHLVVSLRPMASVTFTGIPAVFLKIEVDAEACLSAFSRIET